MHLLTACHSAPSGVADRQVLERLWVHFLSSLESFLSDLRKTRYLIGRFPLSQQSDRRALVNSGRLTTHFLWRPAHFCLTSCLCV